jgi:hypothetical protein
MRFKSRVEWGSHFGTEIECLINKKASDSTNRFSGVGVTIETRLEITQEILANLLEFLADKKIMSQADFHKIVEDHSLEFQEEEAD